MSWLDQPRTLEIVSAGLPKWRDECLFTVSRLTGAEKLGKLYDYTVEIATKDDIGLTVHEARDMVKVDQLVGKQVTVKIAIEGSGTYETGKTGVSASVNVGAGVREITGLIVSAQCVGADTRRAFYRLRVRPWLWLATLNQDSRIFQDKTVLEISEIILKKYPFHYELRIAGPGFGRQYPKRDYQRMFWESDWDYLNRLWQEWGMTFFYDGPTLVLCDSTGAYKKHGPAYATLRYRDRDGQRIDEEHVHQFEIARALTTGKVSVTDYDYTQSRANLATKDSDYRERANDNIEHYAWGDYSQPLAGAMGTAAQPNEVDFEGEHLARVRLEAKRAKSLRGKGRGNMRGLRVGYTFHLEDYPLAPGNGEYLVVATKIEIVNNDTVTNRGALQRQYTCDTQFTVQPANTYFRTPQKAKKPRSHGEVAIVTGYSDSKIWTDKYGRAKVWFPWDREGKPDQDSSCWVRVSSPWQGANYGAIYIPRAGHEVVIGYQDNDPDKPYIVGRHVNQFHEPPWPLPANQALSGWMSEDLEGPTTNSVVTDDTPGKLQVQVASDHAQSRLVLGSNTRIDRRKGRSEARGEGFELATEAHGVARANLGMLLTTETRAGAGAPVKDMGETVQRLTQARELHEDMAQFAQRHKAQDAQVSQGDATAGMKAQNEAIKGGAKSTSNPSPEMTRPDLVLVSAAGIAVTASDSMHLASQNDHAITAGRDVSIASGRSWVASVRGALSFVAALGIRLFAAKGKVAIQAQNDEMALAALKDLTISSTDGRVVINSAREVWIGAGGSFIQINGSGIVNGSPGPILEKGAKWSKSGADSKRVPLPGMPIPENEQAFSNRLDLSEAGQVVADLPHPWANLPYLVTDHTGNILTSGTLDEAGSGSRVFARQAQDVDAWIGTSGWDATEESWNNDASEEMRA